MHLSDKEVEHIADLARLRLTGKEMKMYGGQLSGILDYVDKLAAVDTSAIEPTSQVTGLSNIARSDEIIDSGISEELVKAAPKSGGGFVKVPKIFEHKN